MFERLRGYTSKRYVSVDYTYKLCVGHIEQELTEKQVSEMLEKLEKLELKSKIERKTKENIEHTNKIISRIETLTKKKDS